jgi:spermidine/putrescine transport system permease protein
VVLAHIGYAAAFAVGIIRMRLLEMDRNLEKAAWNLGANSLNAVFRVVVPMALPTLIAAFFLTMAVSWNEFVIAWFVSGLEPTLPAKIYHFFAGNISPRINAIGTIVLVASFLLLALAITFAFVVGKRTSGGSRSPATD